MNTENSTRMVHQTKAVVLDGPNRRLVYGPVTWWLHGTGCLSVCLPACLPACRLAGVCCRSAIVCCSVGRSVGLPLYCPSANQ